MRQCRQQRRLENKKLRSTRNLTILKAVIPFRRTEIRLVRLEHPHFLEHQIRHLCLRPFSAAPKVGTYIWLVSLSIAPSGIQ